MRLIRIYDSTGNGSIGTPCGHDRSSRFAAVASDQDTINLEGTFNGNNTITGMGLTIQSYGTGATVNAASTGFAFLFLNADGITVSNLTINNAGTSTTTCGGVEVENSDGGFRTRGYTVSGCTVAGGLIGIGGALFTLPGMLGNITISNNNISGTYNASISFGSGIQAFNQFSNVQVTGNVCHDLPSYFDSNGTNAIKLENVGATIAPNVVSGNICTNVGYGSTTGTGAGPGT